MLVAFTMFTTKVGSGLHLEKWTSGGGGGGGGGEGGGGGGGGGGEGTACNSTPCRGVWEHVPPPKNFRPSEIASETIFGFQMT